MNGVIRAAVPDDAKAIAEVHVASSQAAYRGILPEGRIGRHTVATRDAFWRGVLEKPAAETRVWVVEMATGVLGFAAHGRSREADCPSSGEVYVIYMAPSAWGRGLGTLLLRHVEHTLADDGFAEAILWVAAENTRARRFYERAGWSLDGGQKNVDGLAEVRYQRALATGC